MPGASTSKSLKLVLDLAVEGGVDQVFWPSSIAVFGPTSPREMTPQRTVLEPTTMYGVTKLAGENLCAWYHRRHGIDVRSLRYPGLVSYERFSGGGTTDYSVEMFLEARRHGRYTCFVRSDRLAVHGRRGPRDYRVDGRRRIGDHGSHQLQPRRLRLLRRQSWPRKSPAASPASPARSSPTSGKGSPNSWPMTVDDWAARDDWGWAPRFGLAELADAMFAGIDAQRAAAGQRL